MPIDLGKIILQGRNVMLRPLDQGDAEALAKAGGESREHYQYTPVPGNPEAARAYIDRALRERDDGTRYAFSIIYRGGVVGSTSYWDYQPWTWPPGSAMQRVDRPDVCEIGATWLAASAQRTGCNTEAKFLLLSHAFENWAVHRVMFRTDTRNIRSRAAIERLGAKFEGVYRADKPAVDGTVRDSAFYSIIAAEWPVVRMRLSDRMKSHAATEDLS
jgi:RimJ/RimL family protein N-acetyltransferase